MYAAVVAPGESIIRFVTSPLRHLTLVSSSSFANQTAVRVVEQVQIYHDLKAHSINLQIVAKKANMEREGDPYAYLQKQSRGGP